MITRHAGFPMLLSRIAIANTVTKHVTPLMVISSKMWFSRLATSATAEKIDRPRPIFSGSSNPGLDFGGSDGVVDGGATGLAGSCLACRGLGAEVLAFDLAPLV